jgi:hypothetical protein
MYPDQITFLGVVKMADEYGGGDRSELEHEGNAMLRLILGRTPSRSSVGEYVDAIGAIGDRRSLGLPHWALAPGVLTLLQGPILFRRGLMHAVRRRMNIAFQIGETEPAPSRYFRTTSASFLTAASMIIVIGMTEAFRMVCSVIVGSVLAMLVASRSSSSW